MNVLDTIEAETDFNVVEDKLREADHALILAFGQNEKLLNALHEARSVEKLVNTGQYL